MKTLKPVKTKWEGSFQNRINENRCYKKEDQPVVGMGATEYLYSDRNAMTVVEVNNNWKGKGYDIVVCQRDNAERKDSYGMSDSQDYEYTPNPNGRKITLQGKKFMHPDNILVKVYSQVRWNEKTKRWNLIDTSSKIGFGIRSEYYDFSF